MTLNRVVAIAAAAVSLALAVLPVLADLDWTSTAGVIAGIAAVLGVTQKWLDGWQKHEAREADSDADAVADDELPEATLFPPHDPKQIPADEGDAGTAQVAA